MWLARKLLITAAAEGVVIRPIGVGSCGGGDEKSSVQIDYETHKIQKHSSIAVAQQRQRRAAPSLEAHGIIGLLSLASYSFLIAISQCQQVAQINGKPVFVVTDVAVIPLSSQEEAGDVISKASQTLVGKDGGRERHGSTSTSSSNSSIDLSSVDSRTTEEDTTAEPGEADDGVAEQAGDDSGSGRTSIAEDVIEKRGKYGRFASRWFSMNGWKTRNTFFAGNADAGTSSSSLGSLWSGKGRNKKSKKKDSDPHQGMMELDGLTTDGHKPENPEDESDEEEDGVNETRVHELLPKLLKYARLLLSSSNYYYSFEYDLTRKLGVDDPHTRSLPFHKRVDPMFFWNRHLLLPFIEAGQHDLVLPLIQGFVGQHEFSLKKKKVPTESGEEVATDINPEPSDGSARETSEESDYENTKFLLTLVSRRSVKRPGLRYLRRGVDDEGNVANMVETEQILSRPSWDPAEKAYSLLQVRGSIPLFFSQSPYYIKPIPVLKHSPETNRACFERHLQAMGERYGKIQALSLIDGHGVEVEIGKKYEEFAQKLNDDNTLIAGSPFQFLWFDFHHECRGLKFENVSRLVDTIASTLDDFGFTVMQGDHLKQKQTGVVRTNCMDCLDRTGVAQCAIAQYSLEKQLQSEGYAIDLHHNESTQWFNILWADNGDAISKQYSSTAALKGDYTRTRKRNMRGALNDLGLTLSRYYNNLVNDYFSQACIDYLLGNVTIHVFDEFEANLMSADPGISLERVRQNAIDACCRIVFNDELEELLGGWSILSPSEPNTLRTLPFEESVLLLTDAAVYCCRFDWDTDKVSGYERVELSSITGLDYGTYITSTLTDVHLNPQHNVGVVISHQPNADSIVRVNTRSQKTLAGQAPGSNEGSKENENEWDLLSFFQGSKSNSTRFTAFKIIPSSKTCVRPDTYPAVKEKDIARLICEEIEHAIFTAAKKANGNFGDNNRNNYNGIEQPSLVRERDIISLAEAKKRTGIFEHLVFDLKKLVWA